MSSIKKICVTAIMIALCCILPTMFHLAGLGTAFSPMHIPVLLAGLICGGWYGLCCGVIGPVLSSILTGMPGATMLISMIPELITYGLVTGLMMRYVRTGKLTADLYTGVANAYSSRGCGNEEIHLILGSAAEGAFLLGACTAVI